MLSSNIKWATQRWCRGCSSSRGARCRDRCDTYFWGGARYICEGGCEATPTHPITDDDTYTSDDTYVTTPASIETFLYTDGAFPRGSNDLSRLTEYADYVVYKLWQGNVYIYIYYV